MTREEKIQAIIEKLICLGWAEFPEEKPNPEQEPQQDQEEE